MSGILQSYIFLFTTFQPYKQQVWDWYQVCCFLNCIIFILIVQQVRKMLQARNNQVALTKTSIFQNHNNQSKIINQNSFVGLTLKEYFHIAQSKFHLDEIHEENNSEVSAGTPCFGGDPDKDKKDKHYRRNRHKTELEQLIIENDKNNSNPKPTQRMVTLSLDQLGTDKQNTIKLPSIHEQRQKNLSRQGMKQAKQSRPNEKKQALKGKGDESNGINLSIFLKKEENAKANLTKNMMNMRRGIRSRVTSTSFYHMNLRQKQRQRIKTEEQIQSGFEKSFVITRYGALMGKAKKYKEEMASLKKYENSFKLTNN